MITGKSVFSEETLLHGLSTHFQHKRRASYLYPIIGVAGLTLGVVTWWLMDSPLLLAIVLFPCLLLLLFMPYNRWIMRRNVRKLPNLNKEVAWQLDEVGLAGEGEGFAFSQDWTAMYEALLTPAGLLIYPQENVIYWIPRTAFADPAGFDAAANLVQQHVTRYRRFV